MAATNRRAGVLGWVAFVFSIFIFISILLLLSAGTKNQLTELYYLKTDLSGLRAASPLADSSFLAALGSVAGSDLVGGDVTASSLNLAETYTIQLLTSCARFSTGTSCSEPRLGFWFNTGRQLRLDTLPAFRVSTSGYRDAALLYQRVSYWQGIAFVIAAAFVSLSAILTAVNQCCAWGGHFAAALSVLSTLFLAAVNISTTLVFVRLNQHFNESYNGIGLKSSLGLTAIVLGWVAFALSLVVSVLLCVRSRGASSSPRYRPRALGGTKAGVTGSRGINDDSGVVGAADGPTTAEKGKGNARAPGFLGRIPTWNNHKYVQIEKQPAMAQSQYAQGSSAVMEDDIGVVKARGVEDDWAVDDQYSRSRYGDGGSGEAVPMRSMAANRDSINTAYEPYTSVRTSPEPAPYEPYLPPGATMPDAHAK